jgi:hypothetical protein
VTREYTHIKKKSKKKKKEGLMEESIQVAKKLRKYKIILGKELNNLDRRATSQIILDIAERICPTQYGFGGGQLFLHWFLQNGKLSTVEQANAEGAEWSPAIKKKLMETEVPKWVMEVITSTNNISQKKHHPALLPYPSIGMERIE